jgi:hypothetical protein
MGYKTQAQVRADKGAEHSAPSRGWGKVFGLVGHGRVLVRTKKPVYVSEEDMELRIKGVKRQQRLQAHNRDLKDEAAVDELKQRYDENHDEDRLKISTNKIPHGKITNPHVSSTDFNEILKKRNSISFQRKNKKAAIMQAAMKSGDPMSYMRARGLEKLAKRGKAKKYFARLGGSAEVGVQWGTLQNELKKAGIPTEPSDLALGPKKSYAPSTLVSLGQFECFVEKSAPPRAPKPKSSKLAPVRRPGGRRGSVMDVMRRRFSMVR